MAKFHSLVCGVAICLWSFHGSPFASPVIGQPVAAPSSKSHLVFKEVASTGLSDILKHRRESLEKKHGKPLKSHAWWLWGLSTFDYDLDGDLDLIVSIHGTKNGLILRNQQKETGRIAFEDVTKKLGVDGDVPGTDNYPLVWDFNGDGYLDIAGLLDDSPTPCLINRAGKRFEKAPYSLHPLNYPEPIKDINGDGYPDIYQDRRGKRVQFTYDPKTESFVKHEFVVPPVIQLPAEVEKDIAHLRSLKKNRFVKLKLLPAELNGDGRLDYVLQAFGSYSGARLGWYLVRDKDDKFRDQTKAMGLPRDGAPLSLLDIDDDGDQDVLIVSSKEGGVYLNDGRGKFTHQPSPLSDFIQQRCPYLHFMFTADLDNDGDLDIAISNRRYGKQKVFENIGGGQFLLAFESKGWDADPLVLRDIDNDGLIDLIIGGAGEKENIGIFLNKTAEPGNHVALNLRMDAPNGYAVGASVELFHRNEMRKTNARPFRVETANPDGSPIHIGLGKATSFELRVKFPGKPVAEILELKANESVVITPAGKR